MKKLLLLLLPFVSLTAKTNKKTRTKKTSNIFEKLDIIAPCTMLCGVMAMICYNEYVDNSKKDEERINSLSTLDPLHITPIVQENIEDEETQEYREIKLQINKLIKQIQNIDSDFEYNFQDKELKELKEDLYKLAKIKVQKQQDNSPISPLIEQNNEKVDDLLYQSTIIHNSINESILNTPESIATPTLNDMMVNRTSYSDDKNIGSLPKTPNLLPSKTSNDTISDLDLNYNNSNKESPLAMVEDNLEGNYIVEKNIKMKKIGATEKTKIQKRNFINVKLNQGLYDIKFVDINTKKTGNFSIANETNKAIESLINNKSIIKIVEI